MNDQNQGDNQQGSQDQNQQQGQNQDKGRDSNLTEEDRRKGGQIGGSK